MDMEYWSQFAPVQHHTVQIRWLDATDFVEVDLASIDHKVWFKPVSPITGVQPDAIPYLPHFARTSMSCWRDLTAVFPKLIEVRVPFHFRE